jgi:uncharacterized protein (DUF302 family)
MEGLKTLLSDFGPEETMSRLVNEITNMGMRTFARINHAELAKEVGQTLLPTELIIFGNPRGGTPLMQAGQTIGIDLPLKVLVWQDHPDKTWLSYNEPTWLVKRHQLENMDQIASRLELALAAMALKVTNNNIQSSRRARL